MFNQLVSLIEKADDGAANLDAMRLRCKRAKREKEQPQKQCGAAQKLRNIARPLRRRVKPFPEGRRKNHHAQRREKVGRGYVSSLQREAGRQYAGHRNVGQGTVRPAGHSLH